MSGRVPPRRPRARAGATLLAHGEPLLWLTGGALVICAAMIAGLLVLVLTQGLASFWPARVTSLEGGR